MGNLFSSGQIQITPQTVQKVVTGFQNVSRVINAKQATGAPLTLEDYVSSFREVLTEEDIQQATMLFKQYVESLADKRQATQPPTYLENRKPADAAIRMITAMSKTVYKEDFPSAEEIVTDLGINDPAERERFMNTYNQIYANLQTKHIPKKYMVFRLWSDLGKYGPWFRGGMIVMMLVMLFQIWSAFNWMVRGVRFGISDFFQSISDWFRPSRYYKTLSLFSWKTKEDPRARRRGRRRGRGRSGSLMVPLSSLAHGVANKWKEVSRSRPSPSITPVADSREYEDLSLVGD